MKFSSSAHPPSASQSSIIFKPHPHTPLRANFFTHKDIFLRNAVPEKDCNFMAKSELKISLHFPSSSYFGWEYGITRTQIHRFGLAPGSNLKSFKTIGKKNTQWKKEILELRLAVLLLRTDNHRGANIHLYFNYSQITKELIRLWIHSLKCVSD